MMNKSVIKRSNILYYTDACINEEQTTPKINLSSYRFNEFYKTVVKLRVDIGSNLAKQIGYLFEGFFGKGKRISNKKKIYYYYSIYFCIMINRNQLPISPKKFIGEKYHRGVLQRCFIEVRNFFGVIIDKEILLSLYFNQALLNLFINKEDPKTVKIREKFFLRKKYRTNFKEVKYAIISDQTFKRVSIFVMDDFALLVLLMIIKKYLVVYKKHFLKEHFSAKHSKWLNKIIDSYFINKNKKILKEKIENGLLCA